MSKGKPAFLALMFVTVALAATPASTAAPAATGSCAAYDDDWGWGGSYVECALSCAPHAGLLVAGAAGDADAGVAAAYNCGGQGAGCTSPTPICAGVAPGLTNTAEDGATCSAESDEWWSSQILVACATLAALPDEEQDPMDIVCKTFPAFPECEGKGKTIEAIRALCMLEFTGTGIDLGTSTLLFPSSFAGYTLDSMVSAARLADGSLVGVYFDGVGCMAFHR